MNNYYAIILLLVAAFPGRTIADNYGGEFLNLPVGAKAIAMGGAFGPLSDDASSLYWNPAGLGLLGTPQMMLAHTVLYDGLANHDYLSMTWPVSKSMTVGAGWIRLGIDDISRFSYTVGTPPIGSFGDNENAFLLSAGKKIDKSLLQRPFKILVGGSMKYIYEKLDDKQATGLGLDMGFRVDINLAEWFIERAGSHPLKGMLPVALGNSYLGNVSLSVVAQDIGGTSIAWNTSTQHNDVRSAIYKMGLAYKQPFAPLKTVLTLVWEGANDNYYDGSLGAEIRYRDMIAFRAGRFQSKPTFGAGLCVWRITVDYAYNSHDLGNTHRIGGSYRLR